MRKFGVLAALAVLAVPVAAQQQPQAVQAQSPFVAESVMIPMRDGAKLHAVIFRPRDQTGPLPILFARTPYGVRDTAPASMPRAWAELARDGYIFVEQDMRGRFKSEGGPFTLSTAVHPGDKKAVDEATDAYDSIDWLVNHVANNNGKVGMWGVSYPGFAAAVALVGPHPALKAVSPQAAWIDYWMNDDLHRWGAMRLTYATDWVSSLQVNKTNWDFDYPRYDTYQFFLDAGSPADIEAKYFKGRVPRYQEMIDHPDYDAHWKSQRWSDSLGRTTVPTLNVAGYWDQEDPWGSWQIYYKQKQDDPNGLSLMVAGPWAHGTWRTPNDAVGRISFGVESGTQFQREVEAPFFAYWLHGKGSQPKFGLKSFQSGSWQWKTYAQWPLPGASTTSLYFHADGSLSFTAPAAGEACRDYVSDPARPVPFRPHPMSATYATPDWRWWEAEDQRFVDDRPDVLSYVSAPLTSDMTVTGAITATLKASTSGTDSDFVVKLIDVFPEDYEKRPTGPAGAYAKSLNGYELPIAMEIRRGRYLASYETPTALVPGKVTDWTVPLRDHDHVFKAGHRIMVQVQSSWFPVIDRNPQSFVPNIYKAKPADYVKATQKVCAGSMVALPVVK
jgi:putative CocE/NonD family hydrolase